jgi:hypothetical protein
MVIFYTYDLHKWGQANYKLDFNFNKNRKVGFLVVELTWKLFSETGNIETYLLLKELENGVNQPELGNLNDDKISTFDTNM